MNRFRPQGIPKSVIIKHRRRYGRSENYNWQTRIKWYPAGWGVNKKVISNIHSRLHYLACHAPKPIQKRWWVHYANFTKRHFGTHHASVRFLNNWSCHSWM